MTRGRDANTAYLYHRSTEPDYQEGSTGLGHVMARGTRHHAARQLRATLAKDEQPISAHDLAATAAHASLLAHVSDAVDRRAGRCATVLLSMSVGAAQ
jgi:hypothetical protein